MLYPDLVRNIYFLKEFKEFHDKKYKIDKGEHIIWIELYILVVLFSLLIISFLKTSLCDPGNIPDNEVWNINIPENFPIELQSEFIALIIDKREDLLNNNRNIITETVLNETFSTDSIKK